MQNMKILTEDVIIELKKFASMHNDVIYIYVNKDTFIIVIDDILSAVTMMYYDFCVDLANLFDAVNDFYIFDSQECMIDKNYVLIYERD